MFQASNNYSMSSFINLYKFKASILSSIIRVKFKFLNVSGTSTWKCCLTLMWPEQFLSSCMWTQSFFYSWTKPEKMFAQELHVKLAYPLNTIHMSSNTFFLPYMILIFPAVFLPIHSFRPAPTLHLRK